MGRIVSHHLMSGEFPLWDIISHLGKSRKSGKPRVRRRRGPIAERAKWLRAKRLELDLDQVQWGIELGKASYRGTPYNRKRIGQLERATSDAQVPKWIIDAAEKVLHNRSKERSSEPNGEDPPAIPPEQVALDAADAVLRQIEQKPPQPKAQRKGRR